MKKVFSELRTVFKSCDSILEKVDEISKILSTITDEIVLEEAVNLVRAKVQQEAVQAVINNDGRGMIVMATGSGKSKVAVDLVKFYEKQLNFYDGHALVVPTEKLRDENWKEEFEKWGAKGILKKTERLCYASASKIEDFNLNLLILDEAHNITELSSSIFHNNHVENVVALTATPPESIEKQEIFARLGIPIVYQITLDQAVKLGFVAPYKIKVIYTTLNDKDKNVVSGSKSNPFYQTEVAKYDYLNTVYENSPKFSKERFRATMNRMRFIYNLKSKTEVVKYLLEKVVPDEDRTLIFCGSIEQANEVNPYRFHSKSKSNHYNDFKAGIINRLSCVQAINEGHNFVKIDGAVIAQLNSKEKDLIQRIGRTVRFRPGHEAELFIVVAKNTKDEEWLQSAIENLDKERIEFMNFEELRKIYGKSVAENQAASAG